MNRVFLIALALVMLNPSTFAQVKNNRYRRTPVAQELKALTVIWEKALVKRDVNTLDRILADDYIISGVLPKAVYLALVKNPAYMFESPHKEEIQVQVYGDTAVLFGVDSVCIDSKEGGRCGTFPFIDVWVRQQGHWRCVATMPQLLIIPKSFTIAEMSEAPDGSNSFEQELRKLEHMWDEAIMSQDIKVLDRILADDFVLPGSTSPSMSKSFYLGWTQTAKYQNMSSRKDQLKIRIYNDTAVLFGRHTMSWEYEGTEFSRQLHFMDVWVKRQDDWRCIATASRDVENKTDNELKEKVTVGPEVRADLLIYFKADVSDEQISRFWNETLSIPLKGGTWPRDGIRSISIVGVGPVQGHTGIAVMFHADATQAQREEIKSRIKSSPIVYKVFENIAPGDVKKID